MKTSLQLAGKRNIKKLDASPAPVPDKFVAESLSQSQAFRLFKRKALRRRMYAELEDI